MGAERGDRGAARPGSRGSRRVLGAAPVDAAADLYRLVAGGYPKTDNAYSRLGKHLAKARRAELIGFDAIRDDGITRAAGFGERYGDESPEDYIDGVRDRLRVALAVNSYRRGAHEDQPHHIAVWCEAAGMVPQLARAVGRYGVDVWSCGGTDSLTAKKRMADRICRRGEPSVLLHIGDYDRHGLIIFDALAEDLEEFTMVDGGEVEVVRVAVTEEQIERLGLASFGGAVQAEAIPPDVLAKTAEDAVLEYYDQELAARVAEAERAERAYVDQLLADLRDRVEIPDDDE